jgi:preprotein translocase subunit YajC
VNHLFSLAPGLVVAATKSSTSSASSYTFLIFIVIVVVALYFLFLRPNQQKARRQREENAAIGVGDRVVTIGGIVGTIEEMQGDRVVLVSENPGLGSVGASSTRLVVLRSAIARKAPVETPAEPADNDEADEHDDPPEGSKE